MQCVRTKHTLELFEDDRLVLDGDETARALME